MTSRMPVHELIVDLMNTSGARMEFMLINGREPDDLELAEFKPKYIAAVKAGAYRLTPTCPTCGHAYQSEDE